MVQSEVRTWRRIHDGMDRRRFSHPRQSSVATRNSRQDEGPLDHSRMRARSRTRGRGGWKEKDFLGVAMHSNRRKWVSSRHVAQRSPTSTRTAGWGNQSTTHNVVLFSRQREEREWREVVEVFGSTNERQVLMRRKRDKSVPVRYSLPSQMMPRPPKQTRVRRQRATSSLVST